MDMGGDHDGVGRAEPLLSVPCMLTVLYSPQEWTPRTGLLLDAARDELAQAHSPPASSRVAAQPVNPKEWAAVKSAQLKEEIPKEEEMDIGDVIDPVVQAPHPLVDLQPLSCRQPWRPIDWFRKQSSCCRCFDHS